MKSILIFDQAESAGGSIARAVDLANEMHDIKFIFITYHPLKKLYPKKTSPNVKAEHVYSFYNYQKKKKHTDFLKSTIKNKLLVTLGVKLIALLDWFNERSVLAQVLMKTRNQHLDIIQANSGIHFIPYRLANIKGSALLYYFRHLDDYRWAPAEMLNRASNFIFVGENLMGRHLELLDLDRSKCQVVHSPFDVQKSIRPTDPENLQFLSALKNKGLYVIVQAARICEEKGQHITIDAIIKLKKEYSNIALILAGDFEDSDAGSYEAALRKKIKKNRLEDRVLLIGQRKDILQILQHADIALQAPLWFEALSGSLVEAMQLGVLTISADIGGASEVITHNHTGLLFTAGDSSGLALLIKKIIEGDVNTSSIIEAGKEHTTKNWNPTKIQDQMRTIYDHAPLEPTHTKASAK